MRLTKAGPITQAVVMALIVATCGGGNDEVQPTAEEDQVQQTFDDERVLPPDELANLFFQAVADGDNETWRNMYSDEAVIVFQDGSTLAVFGDAEWVVDDYDGDGVTSQADQLQVNNVLHEPAGQTMDWECSTIAVNEAQCIVTVTDAFIEAGGGDPIVNRSSLTFEEGRIISEIEPQPLDPAAADTSFEAMFTTTTAYERWVSDTYPEQYPAMFHEPCCDYSMILLPDSVARHTELMPEYFTTIE